MNNPVKSVLTPRACAIHERGVDVLIIIIDIVINIIGYLSSARIRALVYR